MPWQRELGGARIQLELAEALRKRGHHVDKFSPEDAFRRNGPVAERLRLPFAAYAQRHVARIACNYDVIDALEGALPARPRAGFGGVLVSRSLGSTPAYWVYRRFELERWPDTRGNRIARAVVDARHLADSWLSLRSDRAADLVLKANRDETRIALRRNPSASAKARFIPFGLSADRLQAFAAHRHASRVGTVAFVGSWTPRKGARDWPSIIDRVRQRRPATRFRFLGTYASAEAVRTELGHPGAEWIEVHPTYRSDELPNLLAGADVGALPSYMEGFPFAVLEMFAAGLPVVAYNAPGARELVPELDSALLVKRGSVEAFSNALIDALAVDDEGTRGRAGAARRIAARHNWDDLARITEEAYRAAAARSST